jgi:hypothetical protein
MDKENSNKPTGDKERSEYKARSEFGSYTRQTKAIEAAVGKAIAVIANRRVHEFIPEENTRRFMHGAGWSSPGDPDRAPDEMIRIEDVFTLRWSDVIDHNLSIISASINSVANNMADKQIKHLFESVSKACDRSGNMVDGSQRSIPEAFMEMLEKIEFGVGANGDVSLPSIYVGPDMGDRILKELHGQPPEFQTRAETLIENKKAEALQKEEARLKRYKAFEE